MLDKQPVNNNPVLSHSFMLDKQPVNNNPTLSHGCVLPDELRCVFWYDLCTGQQGRLYVWAEYCLHWALHSPVLPHMVQDALQRCQVLLQGYIPYIYIT